MKIPVIVTTTAAPEPGDTVIHLAPPIHAHAGEPCVACAAIGDVRVALYDLLESRRMTKEPLPDRVIVDISAVPDDAALTRDRIAGKAPATAMRDHIVARSFILAG